MNAEILGSFLAPLNAGLNLTSLVCLLVGFRYIKNGKPATIGGPCWGAVTASALFLVFYLLRYSLTGTHRFAGEGWAKQLYLTVLFSHMVMAVVVAPLVLGLLYFAWKSRFEAHRRLARWTFPIWLYVSFTGLLVYFLLYHVYGYL